MSNRRRNRFCKLSKSHSEGSDRRDYGAFHTLESLEPRQLMSAVLPDSDPMVSISSTVNATWFAQYSPSSVDPDDPAYRASAILNENLTFGQIAYRGETVDAVTNQWLLQLTKDGALQVSSVAEVNALLGLPDLGGTVIQGLGIEGMVLVQTENGTSADQFISSLKANDLVAYVEPNLVIQTTATPNDPHFGSLWGLHNTGQTGGTLDADIDAVEAWNVTRGSSNTVVAVIDTGVDYTHPDLDGNIWVNPGEIAGNGIDDDGNGFVDDMYGWNFVNNNNNTMDDNGHGTHVAGTIGAEGDNNRGVTGINWDVSIMALKFLNANGSGFTSHAIQAVNYATMMNTDYGINVRVTNNSWGGGGYYAPLESAIRASRNADMLFVAAAGNDGRNNDQSPTYPASYDLDNIISVAATDHRDNLAYFSNYGANTVDIAAPGVSIRSTLPGNSYGNYNGTSMAAPHVTGVAALLFSQNPQLSYTAVKNAILTGADQLTSLSGKVSTSGRLNANNAVRGMQGSVQADAYEDNDSFAQVNARIPGAANSPNLGRLMSGITISGLNTVDDGNDWFKFNMNDDGTNSHYVRITYDNSQGNLNLRVYRADDMSLVGSSSGSGSTDTVSLNGEQAGDYLIEVWSVNDAVITNYALNIQPSVNLADAYEDNDSSTIVDAAEEAASGSPNLGYILKHHVIAGLNTLDDAEDWFKFSIASRGNNSHFVRINFQHSLGDLDLAVYDENGSMIGRSQSVSNTEIIRMNSWKPGTYYVRVYGYQGAANPHYNLVFRAPNGPRDTAGNTFQQARQVKQLKRLRAYREVVGMGDHVDYYRVFLNKPGELTLQLRGLTNNADIELVSRTGQTIASSTETGTLNESVSQVLARGTYYVRVIPQSAARTAYKIRFLYNAVRPGQMNHNAAMTSTSALHALASSLGSHSTYSSTGAGMGQHANPQSMTKIQWLLNHSGNPMSFMDNNGKDSGKADKILADTADVLKQAG